MPAPGADAELVRAQGAQASEPRPRLVPALAAPAAWHCELSPERSASAVEDPFRGWRSENVWHNKRSRRDTPYLSPLLPVCGVAVGATAATRGAIGDATPGANSGPIRAARVPAPKATRSSLKSPRSETIAIAAMPRAAQRRARWRSWGALPSGSAGAIRGTWGRSPAGCRTLAFRPASASRRHGAHVAPRPGVRAARRYASDWDAGTGAAEPSVRARPARPSLNERHEKRAGPAPCWREPALSWREGGSPPVRPA